MVDGFGCAAHVRYFGNHFHAVGDELLGVFAVKLVLSCAGQSDVHLAFPGLLACEEFRSGELLGVWSHDVVARCAEFEHIADLLVVEAGGIVDVAVGARDSHNLGAEFGSLHGCAPCNVAEARDSHSLALDVVALLLEHGLHEIESAEAGSLGTDARAAEFEALAGECAVVLVDELLVHAVHIAYFAAAYADIAGGNVAVGTEVLPQTEHEGLAEAHDFTVALAAGREVGAALCAAHRQSGEGILECLLEAEELEDRQVDRCVEADTALVRADGVVELYAVADVVLHLALVVEPGYTESDDTVGFDHTFDYLVAFKFGVLVVHVLYTQEHFSHSLEVFLFAGVFGLKVGHDFVYIHNDLGFRGLCSFLSFISYSSVIHLRKSNQ